MVVLGVEVEFSKLVNDPVQFFLDVGEQVAGNTLQV